MNNQTNPKSFANTILIVVVVIFLGVIGYFVFAREPQVLPSQNVSDRTAPTSSISSRKLLIKIPFIDIGNAMGLDDEYRIGCGDKLVYVSREIEETAQPLNAAYRELFAASSTIQFEGRELANPIAEQAKKRAITYQNGRVDVFESLRFVRAEIQDDVARIYLEGDLVSNECNDSRIEAQIILTAKQFLNINKVVTYLNGKEFDWSKWSGQQG